MEIILRLIINKFFMVSIEVIIVFSKNILRGGGWKKGDHFPSVDPQGSSGVMRNSMESCVVLRNVNPF